MDILDKVWIAISITAAIWCLGLGPLGIYLGARCFGSAPVFFLRSIGLHLLVWIAALLVGAVAVLLWQGLHLIGFSTALVLGGMVHFGITATLLRWLIRFSWQRSLRVAGILYGWTAAAAVVGGSIMAMDDDLDENVQRWVEVPPEPAFRENLYYALMGFGSAQTDDPHTEVSGSDDIEDLVDTQTQILDCSKVDASHINQVWHDNEAIVRQYERLYQYRRLQSTARASLGEPMLPLLPLMTMHKMTIAKSIADFCKGETESSMVRLRQDIAFSRFLLENADQLLLKVAAVAMFKRHLRCYAAMLEAPSLIENSTDLLRHEIGGLTPEELDMTPCLKAEFRKMLSVVTDMEAVKTELGGKEAGGLPDIIYRILWKPRHAANYVYHIYHDAMDALVLPPDVYVKRLSKRVETSPDMVDIIRNPIAVLLVEIGRPSLRGFKQAIHDTDGLTRLVRIKQKLLLENVPPSQIPQYIRMLPDDLKNPYTHRSMSVDLKTHLLFFSRPDIHGDKRISIPFRCFIEDRREETVHGNISSYWRIICNLKTIGKVVG